MRPFVEKLQEQVLIADGAMGTALQDRGVHAQPFDLANLTHPEWVLETHRAYIAAGADLIETNTYSSNRVKLEQFDRADRLAEINAAGARLAREAAGDRVYVFGSVGPVGRPLAPTGSIPDEVAEAAVREQVEVLLDGPIDGLILETFYDMREFEIAVRTAREMTDLPIIASKTFIEDGETIAQGLPEEVAERVSRWGVTAIGANCTVGPQRMLDIVRQLAGATDLPICAMPTPGLPQLVLGRIVYDTTPEYFAKNTARLVEAGARIVGGCCGVTPEHMKAVGEAVRGLKPSSLPARAKERRRVEPADLPQAAPSRFKQEIGKTFQIAVELDLPRGLDLQKVLDGAKSLRERGANVIDISDGARARLRMNAMAASRLIQEECGIEVMMHFSCRDRNLLAIQADLLGAHALGIQNILAVTGDPAQIGDYPTATSVFDLDSIGMVRVLSRLNDGIDMAGNSIRMRTNFTIAVAFDPLARDMDLELSRLSRKVQAGAHVAYTQPLFDVETARRAAGACREAGTPMMAGVLPLRSLRHAEFMHNEVPGIHVPEEIRRRLEEAGDEQAAETGVAIAQELVREIRDCVQGLYLMPPFGNHSVAEAVMEAVER